MIIYLPVPFALFINDFTQYVSTAYGGLNIVQSCYPSLMNNEDIVLLKLFVLLYTDDTILLAKNEIELQLALNKVYEYCMMFNLSVNTTKTKIIVFSRGKVRSIPTFHYGCELVEVVSDYVYLGITMNYNNKFEKATRKQMDQGRNYGCEIWGLNLRICWKYFTGNLFLNLISKTIHTQLHDIW